MTTNVTVDVGTGGGRDFSTMPSCIAAMGDLVSKDENWTVEVFRDSSSPFTAGMDFTTVVTDATRRVLVTAGAGQSLFDNRSNPLFYSATLGAAFALSGAQAINLTGCQYITIQRLQFTRASAAYDPILITANGSTNCELRDILIGNTGGGCNNSYILYAAIDTKVVNVLLYDLSTGGPAPVGIHAGNLVNCNVYNARGDGTGVDGATSCNNTSVFGWGSVGTATAGDYNATDAASFPVGTHNQLSKLFANQFASAADFRPITGSDFIDHGNTHTDAPNDITGLARGAGLLGDIGPWEADVSVPLTQYYIGADQTDGGWTKNTGGNTDLFAAVDEPTTPDNTDYIQSAVNPSSDVCELKFIGVQTPSGSSDHTVSYVIKRDNSTPLRVDLINAMAGGDQIVKTWNHTGAGDATFTRYDQTFSPSDGVGIADYSDLRLRTTAG